MSPEASVRHQRRTFDLAKVLDAVCPAHLRVSGGPVNLDIGNQRHLEPDLAVKRAVYQELGTPSYWLVDPLEPSITVLDLEDGGYVETARVGTGEVVEVTRPFPVRRDAGDWTRLD